MTGSIGFAKQKPAAQRTGFGKAAGKFPAKKPGVNQDGTQARKALVPKPKKGK